MKIWREIALTIVGSVALLPSGGAASAYEMGVNLAGPVYSWENYPLVKDLNYIKARGVTLIRLQCAWERLQPKLQSSLDATEISNLQNFLTLANTLKMQVIIDIHDWGRYNFAYAASVTNPVAGQYYAPDSSNDLTDAIGSTAVPVSAFAQFWGKLAFAVRGYPALAGYDLMNEPHDMASGTAWPTAAQAAVTAIRAYDHATTIYVEGDGWASAQYWPYFNQNLSISDPAAKLTYEAHEYFDDSSGNYTSTYDQYNDTAKTGAKYLQPFLTWLTKKKQTGFIGEFGVPRDDPRWLTLLTNYIATLKKNNLSGTYFGYTYPSFDPTVDWWPVMTGEVPEMLIDPYSSNGVIAAQWSIITH